MICVNSCKKYVGILLSEDPLKSFKLGWKKKKYHRRGFLLMLGPSENRGRATVFYLCICWQ